MHKIELLINEKRAELNLLEQELYDALRNSGDPDYEYAARITPIIHGIQGEIEKLKALGRCPDPAPGEGFDAQVWQLLTGPYQALEIWVGVQNYRVPQTTRLLEMRKLKARHTLSCIIRFDESFHQYLYDEWVAASLGQIGWRKMPGGKIFRRRAVIRNLNDLEALCRWMSVTLLEGFAGIWREGESQYYRFTR